ASTAIIAEKVAAQEGHNSGILALWGRLGKKAGGKLTEDGAKIIEDARAFKGLEASEQQLAKFLEHPQAAELAETVSALEKGGRFADNSYLRLLNNAIKNGESVRGALNEAKMMEQYAKDLPVGLALKLPERAANRATAWGRDLEVVDSAGVVKGVREFKAVSSKEAINRLTGAPVRGQ